jgi:signal transduction histidine kinase
LLTPVSELRAAAENALQWRSDPAATGRLAEDTLESANQMERLVRTLLLLARSERGEARLDRTTFDLMPLLHEGLKSVAERIATRSLRLKTSLPESAAIVGEPAACASMLQNLLQNAVEYTPESGEIECRLEPTGKLLKLVVANTNPGLDPAELDRIWEPFWRRDSARSDRAHSGLGLSLVRALARVQGFEIIASLPTQDRFQVLLSMPTQSAFETT